MTPLPSHWSLKLIFAKKSILNDPRLVPLSLLHSDYFIEPIKILHADVFHDLAGLKPWKSCGCIFFLKLYLHFCTFFTILPTSTFPSCWSLYVFNQFLKISDCSNPTSYCPIALTSCFSKFLKSTLKRKILKYLPLHNFISDHHCGFFHAYSTADQTFLHVLFSFKEFAETFIVGRQTSKTFDRVYHKPLIYKLSSYHFYPPLSDFMLSFLSHSFIAAVVDHYCSSRFINNKIPQSSVLSLILLFISHLATQTSCSILS